MVAETGGVAGQVREGGWERATTRVLGRRGAPAGAAFLIPGSMLLTCAHVVAGVTGLPEDQPLAAGTQVTVDFPLAAGSPAMTARVIFSRANPHSPRMWIR
jgi:hypothetical protein